MRNVARTIRALAVLIGILVAFQQPATAHKTQIDSTYSNASVNSSHDTLTVCHIGPGEAVSFYYIGAEPAAATPPVSNGCLSVSAPPNQTFDRYNICDVSGCSHFRDDQNTAAARHGWGDPLPQGSDEFNYGSESSPAMPDQTKWLLTGDPSGECWPGHAENGRRCEENTRVVGGMMRQVGEANGDTGFLGSRFSQQYGRWEVRARSRVTGGGGGNPYHPILILWPTSDVWPEGAEYDFSENGSPGEQCAEAFIHYPHDVSVDIQQEHAIRCPVDLTQWHNFAIEWTPDHVRGFLDGEQWFSFSGGANDDRDCIQCAPGPMNQTIQLDNFTGGSMQPAVFEVDWARVYPLS